MRALLLPSHLPPPPHPLPPPLPPHPLLLLLFIRGLNSRPPCLQHYLDYEGLKRSIKPCAQAQQDAAAAAAWSAGGAHAAGQGAATAHLLDARKVMFQDRLDAEVLKVLAFYKQRSQELLQVSSAAQVCAALANGHRYC